MYIDSRLRARIWVEPIILKLSQQIISVEDHTAFTIPTEKQRSHTFAIVAMIKSRILAATIQVSYSYHPVSLTFYGVP